MPKQPFSTESHYLDSIRGLLKLHELEVAGAAESDEADAVRAALEGPWRLMTDLQRKRITGLSEDLYSITQPPEPRPMSPAAQRGLADALEARQAGEWDTALERIRSWEAHIDPALAAYVRGSIWMEAGDPPTAMVFFRHAADLATDNPHYASLYLHTLHAVHPRQANERAEAILLQQPPAAPSLIVKAAEIRLLSTRELPDVDARPIVQDLIDRLVPIVNSSNGSGGAEGSIDAMGLALVALCYDRLGDVSASLTYYNRGIAATPRNDALLVARGILRYGREPEALSDFEAAIRLNTPLVWPFFFLAHRSLIDNRFEECLRSATRGVERPASDSVRANLFEWMAISMSELGFPSSAVRKAFEEALRLDPENDRIRANFDAYELAAASPSSQPAWQKAPHTLVQGLGHAQYRLLLAA